MKYLKLLIILLLLAVTFLISKESSKPILIHLLVKDSIVGQVTSKNNFFTKIIFFSENEKNEIKIFKTISKKNVVGSTDNLKVNILTSDLQSVEQSCKNCEVILKVEYCVDDYESNSTFFFGKKRFRSVRSFVLQLNNPIDIYFGRKIDLRKNKILKKRCTLEGWVEVDDKIYLDQNLESMYFFYMSSKDYWIYKGEWRLNFQELLKQDYTLVKNRSRRMHFKLSYMPYIRSDSFNYEEDNHIAVIGCHKGVSFRNCIEEIEKRNILEERFFVLDTLDYSGINCYKERIDFFMYPKINLYDLEPKTHAPIYYYR